MSAISAGAIVSWQIGYGDIDVKCSTGVNFSFAPQRIERLKATPEFRAIATSKKKPGKQRDEEIRIGEQIQAEIFLLLGEMDGTRVYRNRDEFHRLLESAFKGLCWQGPSLDNEKKPNEAPPQTDEPCYNRRRP
jgi:hypothetical protein